MNVEGVIAGGPELAIASFSLVLFVLLVLNWGSIFRFLLEGEKSKSPMANALVGAITRIKISLLKFSGASKHDISSNDGQYINANYIGRTYFAQNKLKCFWQLFSYYMLYCLILVFLAKPIDITASQEAGKLVAFGVSKDAPSQIVNIAILAVVNVVTDLLSLAITFINLTRIGSAFSLQRYATVVGRVAFDLVAALLLFSSSQLVSNFLYPMALEKPPLSFDPWSIEAALMPYAFLESVVGAQQTFYPVTFPGQLFITGTVFLPTFVGMALVLLVSLIFLLVRLSKKIQDIYFGTNDADEAMLPEPLGGIAASAKSRSDRCLYFAISSMLTITQSVIGGVMVLAVGKFLGLV